MLKDGDCAKICKKAEKQEDKAGINEIATVGVTEFGTGQFAERGREIAPGVGIGNWIQRQPEALPDGPGKNEHKQNPIKKPPNRISSGAGRLIACRLRDHFQGSANV